MIYTQNITETFTQFTSKSEPSCKVLLKSDHGGYQRDKEIKRKSLWGLPHERSSVSLSLFA